MHYFIKGTNILHREDSQAIQLSNGDKYWFKEGDLHREDGPAIEYGDGSKVWFKEGTCHREDGAAIEYPNGDKEYWIKGKYIKGANSIEEAIIKNLLE